MQKRLKNTALILFRTLWPNWRVISFGHYKNKFGLRPKHDREKAGCSVCFAFFCKTTFSVLELSTRCALLISTQRIVKLGIVLFACLQKTACVKRSYVVKNVPSLLSIRCKVRSAGKADGHLYSTSDDKVECHVTDTHRLFLLEWTECASEYFESKGAFPVEFP